MTFDVFPQALLILETLLFSQTGLNC